MLNLEDFMNIRDLKQQGWSVSARPARATTALASVELRMRTPRMYCHFRFSTSARVAALIIAPLTKRAFFYGDPESFPLKGDGEPVWVSQRAMSPYPRVIWPPGGMADFSP
jgi:hypothetical protein